MIQCVWHEQRLNQIHSKLGSTELLLTKSLFDRKRNVSSFEDYRYCKSYKLNSERSLIMLGSRWNVVKPHWKQGGVLPVVWLADFGRNDYLLWITSNSCTPIRTPCAVSTCLEWSQFHIVSHCSRNLSQRRNIKEWPCAHTATAAA